MEYEQYIYTTIKHAKNKVNNLFNKYGYSPAIEKQNGKYKIIIPKNLMRIDK